MSVEIAVAVVVAVVGAWVAYLCGEYLLFETGWRRRGR